MIVDENFKSMVYGMVLLAFHLKVEYGELDDDAYFDISKNKKCIIIEWYNGFTEDLSPSGPNGETTTVYEPKEVNSKIHYGKLTKNLEELTKSIKDEVDIIAGEIEDAYMRNNGL